MKRLRPTTIIACLALFLSLGAGAWAAQRYIITRASQIQPSVRSQLKGRIVSAHKQIEVGPVARGATVEVQVLCPAGSDLTGGGGFVLGKLVMTRNGPAAMGRGWQVSGVATQAFGNNAGQAAVFVFCQT